MAKPEDSRSALSAAIELTSRVLAVAAVMVAPGVAGHYLDRRLGTGFLALAGFGVGLAIGVWYLLLLGRSADAPRPRDPSLSARGAPRAPPGVSEPSARDSQTKSPPPSTNDTAGPLDSTAPPDEPSSP